MRRSLFTFNSDMKKAGTVAAVVVFLIWIAVILSLTGKIVRAKFIGDSTTIVNGFYAEKKNDIDMLVIGSSNSFCTVNPLVLYENYGIAAYDFGSSSQPMNISVLYLKEALKRQKPAVVALEVNMMVGDSISGGYEAGLRWGYTDLPLSWNKLKCIYQSVGKIDAEFFSYVFPVFRYHSRWKELSKTDYTYFFQDKTNNTKGYLETQAVSEKAVNLQDYCYDEGTAWIEEEVIACLDEITELCRKNGVTLLLFKAPRENWYIYETEAIRALAEERGLDFIDYNELYYQKILELDATCDFRDEQHLNDFGAQKVSMHLGDYVKAHYEIPDRRGEMVENSWDKALLYRQRSSAQEFMAAETARECLELLQNDENYILIVTNTGADRQVEQWIYENRQIAFQRLWQENDLVHRRLGADSELVLLKQDGLYQILIDDVQEYQAGSRWNIIVYDKITGSITANLCFDE